MSLKIKRHIVAHKWMNSSEARVIFSILQGNVSDEDPQALFVGGCVRNAIMGFDCEDFDVATILPPDVVQEVLEGQGIKVIPTGLDHGTVTAVLGEYKFEITTLRRDVETDGRHADVAYTDCWVEDAKRRDFTVNTLLMDRLGNVYDPLGQGLYDIEAKVIKFVGVPKKRIEEDYLRILRFFRFSALYAEGFDEEGLKACSANAGNISSLSKERITQEFFKIMMCDKPNVVLQIMFDCGVLKEFMFDAYSPDLFAAFCRFQKQYRLGAIASRLFVMAGLDVDNIKAMEYLILFPKVFIKDMQAINGVLNLPDLSCDMAVREAVYRFGRTITAQALMIELTQDRVMNHYASQALEIIQKWDVPTFPVRGGDVINAGIKKGPELGRILTTLENHWISEDFKPDLPALLNKI